MGKISIIPAVAAVVCAVGMAACAAAGWNVHRPEMVVALIISTVGAMTGLAVPIALRSSSKGTVAQAGLVGSVVQMLLTLMLAAAAMVMHQTGTGQSFFIWLLMFYWAMLGASVAVMVSLVNKARPESAKAAGGEG